jgi:PPOX class probable F420-dependent enzyme
MQLSEREIEDLLRHWPVARLASRGESGRPHQVPVVFALSGGTLWSPVDGKPKSGGELARVRNLREHPQASLLLDHYDDEWSSLWWLRVDVRAQVVDATDPGGAPGVVSAVAALEAKYPQYRQTPVLREPPILIALHPTGLRSWRASEQPIESISGPARARGLSGQAGEEDGLDSGA